MGSWKQQLNEKFSGKTKTSMSEMYLIPSLTEKLPESEVFEYYLFDLPSFRQGIQLWKLNWANEKKIPITLSETLKYIIMKNMKEIFPNYTLVLAFSLTTAATSATVEIENSVLRHVKADFRCTMDE